MAETDTETQDTENKLTREQRAVALGVSLDGLAALEAEATNATVAAPAPAAGPNLINRGGQSYPGTPLVAPPNTTPLSSPTARMYMGPNISDSAVRALVPTGRAYVDPNFPAPDMSPEAQDARIQERLKAGTSITRDQYEQQLRDKAQQEDWSGKYTQRGVTDVAGLAKEAALRERANKSMLMNDWYEKAKRVGVLAAGPPPDIRSSTPWRPAASQTTSRNVGGVLYTLNPSTQEWIPQTPVKPPAAPRISPVESKDYASLASRKALVEKELDKLTATPEKDMTPDDIRKRNEWGTELMGIIDQQSRIKRQGQPAISAPTTATASTPFREGQTIRSKKDGKLYVVRNGEAVPVK